MNKFSQLYRKISDDQYHFRMGILESEGSAKRILHAVIGFIYVFYKEMMRDKVFIRSSAIAYTSMLSLVPLIIVGGSLILMFNRSLPFEELLQLLQEHVIPIAGDTISNFLSESLERTLELGTGPVGAIALLVTSVMLFIQIEDVINDVWQVGKSRSFFMRLLLFYAIVTLGPILISISVYQATQILKAYNEYRFLRSFSAFATSILMFYLVFKLFPNTKVKLLAAIIPALVVAICFEILKYGFSIYITKAFSEKYSILYGALGLVPVLLVWMYLIWVMILLGVELSYCLQNYNSLIRRTNIQNNDLDDKWYFLDAYAPLEILSCLVRHFAAGTLPVTIETLSYECRYPKLAIEAIMNKLNTLSFSKDIDTELGKAYILTKPLDDIDLNTVLKTFDESEIRSKEYPRLRELFQELLGEQERVLNAKTSKTLREDL